MDVVINGAAIVGAVSFLSIVFPNLTSVHRVGAVLAIGAVLPYLPDLGPAVKGVELALATGGFYKVATKVGGH